MPDTQKIIDVLSEYKGDMDSLNTFVSVAESEFGPDWTLHIQSDLSDLSDLPVALKGKLDHAYNYYGATVAWNEIQEYLNAEHLDVAEVEERIPVLDYWLKFFGQSGKEVVTQLEQKIQALKDAQNESHQLVEPALTESAPEDTVSEVIEPAQMQTMQEKIDAAFTSEVEPDEEAVIPKAPETTDVFEETSPSIDAQTVAVTQEPAPVLAQEAVEENSFTAETVIPADDTDRFKRPALSDNDAVQIEAQPVVAAEITPTSVETPEQPVQETVSEVASEVETVEETLPEPVVEQAEPVVSENDLPAENESVHEEEVSVEPVIEDVSTSLTDEPVSQTVDEAQTEAIRENEPAPVVLENSGVSASAKTQDPVLFMVDKIERQLDFLHQTQAWISARCVELGNIEPYTYTYYGFLMDVYQQTVRDIQSVLTNADSYAVIQQKRPDAIKKLKDTEVVLKSELDFSKDLFNTNPAPLIDQDVSANQARQTLGGLDTSMKKEYLGPAPDGFEMLDDPYETESGELDEAKLKSDYEKIEDGADVQLTEIADRVEPVIKENAPTNEKNLANSPQKGVEKKISISLGVKPLRKKAKIEPTDTE